MRDGETQPRYIVEFTPDGWNVVDRELGEKMEAFGRGGAEYRRADARAWELHDALLSERDGLTATRERENSPVEHGQEATVALAEKSPTADRCGLGTTLYGGSFCHKPRGHSGRHEFR